MRDDAQCIRVHHRCITAHRCAGSPWTCALNREFAKAHTLRMAAVPLQLAGGLQAPQGFDLGYLGACHLAVA